MRPAASKEERSFAHAKIILSKGSQLSPESRHSSAQAAPSAFGLGFNSPAVMAVIFDRHQWRTRGSMDASSRAVPKRVHRVNARFEQTVLVLQGGGALGSYQAGVYQALAEANLHPDWVAGISIGAINSALIAGNPPEKRVERLREFW